jgi:hypothetical protein
VKWLQKHHKYAFSPPRPLMKVYIKVREYANGEAWCVVREAWFVVRVA